jgi:hypothetical protein
MKQFVVFLIRQDIQSILLYMGLGQDPLDRLRQLYNQRLVRQM